MVDNAEPLTNPGGNGHDKEGTPIADLGAELTDFRDFLGPLINDGAIVYQKTCPACNSTERIFETFHKYLVSIGKHKAGMLAGSMTNQQIFYNPMGLSLVGAKVPGFLIIRDICRSCGLEYPTVIQRQDVMQTVQATQAKG